jgi:hypothetical protein
MATIDPTKLRDRWGSKTYHCFQRDIINVQKEGDEPGALGYMFPGTGSKFNGGLTDNPLATAPGTPPPTPDPDPDPTP